MMSAVVLAAAGGVSAFHHAPPVSALPKGLGRTPYLFIAAVAGLRQPTLVCLLVATGILLYERHRARRSLAVTGVLLGLVAALAAAAATSTIVAVGLYLGLVNVASGRSGRVRVRSARRSPGVWEVRVAVGFDWSGPAASSVPTPSEGTRRTQSSAVRSSSTTLA